MPPYFTRVVVDPITTPFSLDPFLPYRRRVQATRSTILEWSSKDRGLRPWGWPCTLHGGRVTPDALLQHFIDFLCYGPCCLCASQDLSPNARTESVVFLDTNPGPTNGLYVAACARGVCKYFVILENFFSKRGQRVNYYQPRPAGAPYTPVVFNSDVHEPVTRVSLGRRRRSANATNGVIHRPSQIPRVDLSSTAIPIPPNRAVAPPSQSSKSPFSLLIRMDSINNPGIPYRQFRSLFNRCASCGYIMTKEVFPHHSCRQAEEQAVVDIIDLTLDE